MTYQTPRALRVALEQRLLAHSRETDISLDRLRRRVVFERIVARLEYVEPGQWVIKGGMALEVRLHDDARLTKDLDLGLRDEVTSAMGLHERLIEAFTTDIDGDGFVFTSKVPTSLATEVGRHPTWRTKVVAALDGRQFGSIQLDISPRVYELYATDRVTLPNSLDFAGFPASAAEILDIHRHAAEKLHALSRDFGDRENSRVRDLVDLAILLDHDLLKPATLSEAIDDVWAERDGLPPPPELPPLPASWPELYENLVTNQRLDIPTFPTAASLVRQLWATMLTASP